MKHNIITVYNCFKCVTMQSRQYMLMANVIHNENNVLITNHLHLYIIIIYYIYHTFWYVMIVSHAQNQSDLIEAGQRRTDVAETATPVENWPSCFRKKDRLQTKRFKILIQWSNRKACPMISNFKQKQKNGCACVLVLQHKSLIFIGESW